MSARHLLGFLLLAALALALWWLLGQAALPPALQRVLGRPAAALTSTPVPAAATRLQKCRGGSTVLYTDGPCPQGTSPERADGGSLTVLPAQASTHAAAAAAAGSTAASAVSPLRRLAGPQESAAQRERVLEQALHR